MDGGFTTVEHSLSHSLGNTEVVLENGVVCDRCNNGVLSVLDQALAEFWPLKMRRTMLGVPSKAGKVPVTKFHTGTLTNTGDNNLFLAIHGAKDARTLRTTELGGGRVHMNLEVSGGRRMTPRYASEISRALLKGAFDCAWLDHGEMMLSSEFDHVREAVLGSPRDGYLAILRKADPDDVGLELMYTVLPTDDGRRLLAVAAKFYGVLVSTDSFNPEPKIAVSANEVIVITFKAADIRPRR